MLVREDLKHGSLCVVGNLNRDVKTAPFVATEGLLRDGETSVGSVVETIGGGGANSACAAAAFGARVNFVGKVGRDGLADRLEKTLSQHGVRTFLPKSPDVATGSSLALTYASGQRHFLSSLPASRALRFEDIDLKALDECSHLLRADIWFSESMLHEGNKSLFQLGKTKGLATSIDLNWDPCWGLSSAAEIKSRKQAVRDVLPWVDIAHGNVRELTEFADAPNLDRALARLTDWGARAVLVHLGAKGAGLFQGGSLIVEPPAPVQQHLNFTGTGDVLSVCYMLLDHQTATGIEERLRLANSIVAEFIEGRLNLIPALAD